MAEEQFTKISFYVVAHADDWQLFMQPNAYNDLVAPGSKVVFIITTAGDAGAGETFWLAREEGSKSSIRFCLQPLEALSESVGTREFNKHTINYWTANNATCYFLRLPDGNLYGNGFSQNHYQSLSKFRGEEISAITALDNSTTYKSWPDFYTTLQSIIKSECQGISEIMINYLNPNTDTNPNDHKDHIATGQAIQDMTLISTIKQTLYVGYSVSNNKENLNLTGLFWKSGMFSAYEKAVYDNSGYSTLGESVPTYLSWCLSSAEFITADP